MAHLVTTKGLMIIGNEKTPEKKVSKKKTIIKVQLLDMTADWSKSIKYKNQ